MKNILKKILQYIAWVVITPLYAVSGILMLLIYPVFFFLGDLIDRIKFGKPRKDEV